MSLRCKDSAGDNCEYFFVAEALGAADQL